VFIGLLCLAVPGRGGPLERVELSALRAAPAQHLGAEVSLVIQLSEEVEGWNPFLTRFGPGDYQGFQVWSDDALLWERAAFEDPSRFFFARKGTPAALILRGGRAHERFEVRAIVRDTFLGEPWVEVMSARRLAEHVSEGAILHAARGLQLLEGGRRELARAQFERARAGSLPPHASEELERLLATCD